MRNEKQLSINTQDVSKNLLLLEVENFDWIDNINMWNIQSMQQVFQKLLTSVNDVAQDDCHGFINLEATDWQVLIIQVINFPRHVSENGRYGLFETPYGNIKIHRILFKTLQYQNLLWYKNTILQQSGSCLDTSCPDTSCSCPS